MQTSGHGNDALMILVPAGVLVAVGVMLFGGPAEALEAINAIVGEIARVTMDVVSALFS
jgi:hypothetical protein